MQNTEDVLIVREESDLRGFWRAYERHHEGADPADMVKQNRVDELKHFFKSPYAFIDFVIDEIIAKYDIHSPKAKEAALSEVMQYVKTLTPFLQEEYKNYIASRLGISPSLVRVKNSINRQMPHFTQHQNQVQDPWELSLIKTMLEYPNFIDMILNTIDPSTLQYHRYEFDLALQGDKNSPVLMGILLNESIRSFANEEELKEELLTFLIRLYTTKLKELTLRNDLNFDEKSFYIRKYRDAITHLKRGEFVRI